MSKTEKLFADFHFLGTGTSNGIPFLRCECENCKNVIKHEELRKFRTCSVLYLSNGKTILIDCGTDIRKLALRAGIKSVDGIIITHSHADHVHGLHDLRKFAVKRGSPIPVYSTKNVISDLEMKYEYDFEEDSSKEEEEEIKEKKRKYFDFIKIEQNEEFDLCGVHFKTIPILHGKLPICGYRFGECSYITDCSEIPKESFSIIKGTKILVINSLNMDPHPTHFSFSETLEAIAKIKPKKAFIIHVSHNTSHAEIQKWFDTNKMNNKATKTIQITVTEDHMQIGRIECNNKSFFCF